MYGVLPQDRYVLDYRAKALVTKDLRTSCGEIVDLEGDFHADDSSDENVKDRD